MRDNVDIPKRSSLVPGTMTSAGISAGRAAIAVDMATLRVTGQGNGFRGTTDTFPVDGLVAYTAFLRCSTRHIDIAETRTTSSCSSNIQDRSGSAIEYHAGLHSTRLSREAYPDRNWFLVANRPRVFSRPISLPIGQGIVPFHCR